MLSGPFDVTVMETKDAAVTVSETLPATLPDVAVIVAAPSDIAETRPLLLTVATVVVPDAQVTQDVMLYDVPSEYAPVAVN